MTFARPSGEISQVVTREPAELTESLRACIIGPNAILHRYSESDEKTDINIGEYDHTDENCYSWPERSAGGVVDQNYVKLFMDKALLLYHEDLQDVSTGGRGTVAPVSGYTNRVRSSAVNYKDNGDENPRSALLYDRDVTIGDRVYIRGVDDPEGECVVHELWTYVAGFAADVDDAVVDDADADEDNQESIGPSSSIEQTAGDVNCITAAIDGSTDYNGLADGYPCETYTIEVVQSSISGCDAARLRVTSASGTDNADEVVPEAMGSPTAIGSRGLQVTFDTDTGSCSSSASSSDVPPAEFVIGQTWQVEICQEFEAVCAESGGTYDGADDDTYIIEVTKGGTWAENPEITVTTNKGLDFSGPTVVTGDNVAIPIGTHGVEITFVDCDASGSEPAGATYEYGDSTLAGLCKGDKFYIGVQTGADGPIRTLILRHDLPEALDTVTDLDLRLYIEKDIEVTENRTSDPPNVNFEMEATQICVQAGITAYDSTWTNDGVEMAMPVHGGPEGASVMYVEYREWIQTLVDQVNFAEGTSSLDDIPGQLHEDNPLKWGVYRALQNSNSAKVAYIAVPDDTDDLDDYQVAVDRLDGRDDLYNFVPLTYDREVINLFVTQAETESGPERSNWKAVVCALQGVTSKMIVGKSSTEDQELNPTSSDGELVLAKLLDDPNATGTQYTKLLVPDANSNFVTYGVKAGDVVRFLFTVDGFGVSSYSEFLVDSVLSETSLLLQAGHTSAVNVPQKIEIWRTLSKSEVKDDLIDQAQAFANRRVVAVWPDRPGTDGDVQAGYFLAAAVAGLASGVSSHQGLTNVEVLGFDDLSSYTTEYFTDSQLTALSNGGVWVVQEDKDGTPMTRHAVTTDVSELKYREEMIRRNLDAISYLFIKRLRPLIGRTNATETILSRIRHEIEKGVRFLRTNAFDPDLGGQVISAEITELRIHPLAADTVEIVLNLTLPAPLNYVQLYLVV